LVDRGCGGDGGWMASLGGALLFQRDHCELLM
jgi:hypothetical protein